MAFASRTTSRGGVLAGSAAASAATPLKIWTVRWHRAHASRCDCITARSMSVTSPREKSAHCQVSKCVIGGSHIYKGRGAASKYSGAHELCAQGVAHQAEGSPVERMTILFAHVLHCRLERPRLARALSQPPVKRLHEVSGAAVVR